jgi:HSP20 family protein
MEENKMQEDYVESDVEMGKKPKLKPNKGKTEELKKSTSKAKEDMGQKMGDIKEGASEKKEDVKEKMGKAKETMAEKKEDVSSKIEEVKEGASEKKEDIEKSMGEAKEEVEEQKEKLEKESEEEGMTPAEKILNDIVTRFRQGTGQINEAITDYRSESESETSKTLEKPLVDVLETNDTIILVADISGVKKDDINIGISKNSVELTAIFKEEPEVEDAKFTQKERSYGETHRTIMLPTEIKVKEAKAKYKDCTLTLTLPKTVEDITKVNIED